MAGAPLKEDTPALSTHPFACYLHKQEVGVLPASSALLCKKRQHSMAGCFQKRHSCLEDTFFYMLLAQASFVGISQ